RPHERTLPLKVVVAEANADGQLRGVEPAARDAEAKQDDLGQPLVHVVELYRHLALTLLRLVAVDLHKLKAGAVFDLHARVGGDSRDEALNLLEEDLVDVLGI